MDPIDFIGDVHGCADKLLGLLRTLGYGDDNGAFRHPDRTAIFVGDLIDRGPQQVEVLSIVRSMVEAGSAQVLMGNHEFNAVSYVTPDPREPSAFMRPRNGPKGAKNRHQHEDFLARSARIQPSTVSHRVVQDPPSVPRPGRGPRRPRLLARPFDRGAEGLSEPGRPLPDEFFVRANMHEDPLYRAVETLLKGPEVALGTDGPYLDKEGQSDPTPGSVGGTRLRPRSGSWPRFPPDR